MARYEPHDPKATEPGDHPAMGERKGMWRAVLVGAGAAVGAMMLIWLIVAFT